MTYPETRRRAIRRAERVYYTAQALFWFSVSLPLALSVLLIQARGIDLLQIGLLLGVYAATVVVLEVPSGGLADAWGRKRITLLAHAFLLLSSLVFLFAFSFLGFLAFYVLNGVGRAFASGALQAWFVDRLQEADPKVDLQPPLARAGTFELLALTAGTLLGSYLPTLFAYLPEDGMAVLTPLSVPVALSVLVKVVLLAFVALFIREEHAVGDGGGKLGIRKLATLVGSAFGLSRRNPTLLLLFGATLASGFSMAGIETFWQPRFETLLGGSEGNTFIFGVIMAGSFLVGALGNMASIPLSRLFRKRYGLLAATFQGLQGLSLVLLALQTAPLSAAGLFWLVYLTMAVRGSPSMTLFNLEVPSAQRASLLSVASLVSYAGFFVGSVALGYVADGAGVPLAWLIAGGVTGLSLLFYLQVDVRAYRKEDLTDTSP